MRLLVVLVVILFLFSSEPIAHSQTSGQAVRVRVVGLIKVKPGHEVAFESLVTRMVARTKREDRGNVRYEFFRASAAPRAQSLSSDQVRADYVFEEEWINQQSLDAHLKWALPLLQTEWKALTERTDFLRLAPLE